MEAASAAKIVNADPLSSGNHSSKYSDTKSDSGGGGGGFFSWRSPPVECSPFLEDSMNDDGEVHTLRRILLLVNPFSGNSSSKKVLEEVLPAFEKKGVEVDVRISEYARHLPEVILELPPDDFNYDCICVCGGDGTFQEVADAVVRKFQLLPLRDESPDFSLPTGEGKTVKLDFEPIPRARLCPLAILPGGTGNSTALTLGIDDLDSAMRTLLAGYSMRIDVGVLRLNNKEDPMYFTHNISWGLFADVLATAENVRWLRSSRYDVCGVWHILKNQTYDCKMKIDGVSVEGDFQLVFIQSNQHGGSGLRLAPFAVMNDGLMDLYLKKNEGRISCLSAFNELKRSGSHVYDATISHYRFKELEFFSTSSPLVAVDGDILNDEGCMPFRISVCERVLPLVVPRAGKSMFEKNKHTDLFSRN